MAPCCIVPDLSLCTAGPCCSTAPDPSPEIQAVAAELALSYLWSATGRRFARTCDPITVRPCNAETCKPNSVSDVIWWEARRAGDGTQTLGVMSFFPTLIDGSVYNIGCGCPKSTSCCTCKGSCEVYLPGPICEIIEVRIDGAIVSPAQYVVYDKRKLVFIKDPSGDSVCPTCQDYDVANGEVGSWSVTYTYGEKWPVGAAQIAGLLACEFGQILAGQDTGLPANVQSLVRQGISIELPNPFELIKLGLTGNKLVDLWITSQNPLRLQGRARVWSPDLPITRRES